MKNQFAITIGLLLISTYSFAQTQPKCASHVTKAAEIVESAEVLNQVDVANRTVGQRVAAPQSTIEEVTSKERQDYVRSKCGPVRRFNRDLHAQLSHQTPESFPLASRVACDEIIVSAAENQDIYASNKRDFVNFGCGTSKEYVNLVDIQISQPQSTSEIEDISAFGGDRESRQQMLQAAREEFNARNTHAHGAK